MWVTGSHARRFGLDLRQREIRDRRVVELLRALVELLGLAPRSVVGARRLSGLLQNVDALSERRVELAGKVPRAFRSLLKRGGVRPFASGAPSARRRVGARAL